MKELEYQLCDVFTETPLKGNQLAVFTDAGDLSRDRMQQLAHETNLSETTFLCRRDAATEQERGFRVRIFTTQEELPFAGHPALGTAATIRNILPEYAQAETIRLDLDGGVVPVRFSQERSGGRVSFGEMTQPEPKFRSYHDRADIAPLLGLTVDDLDAAWQPRTVSTGLPFCVVILGSIEALSRFRVAHAQADTYLRDDDAQFFYAIAHEKGNIWRARMQFYNGEDPATGSAAGCAISYLVSHGIAASEATVHLRQGIEMGRPSDIFARAKLVDDKVSEVRISGSTVSVAKGRFFLE